MDVIRLDRNHPDFYNHLGPIFGSRIIEQATRDRFYDDPEKQWYLLPGMGVASVRELRVKNFWAVSTEAAALLIDALKEDYRRLSGVLPRTYEAVFERKGFQTSPYRRNFIEVQYLEKD